MTGPEVVCAGEAMAVAIVEPGRRLRLGGSLTLSAGGSELNVAVALSRLGVSAGWVSRLGDDELGALVRGRARAEGVDLAGLTLDPAAPTGLYLRERIGHRAVAHYYRDGSAASRLSAADAEAAPLGAARFVHLSGIVPALSASARGFALALVERARRAGVRVSFDVNHRSRLWPPDAARAFLDELLPRVDVLFVADEEAEQVWGRCDAALAADLLARGPAEVVLKRAGRGACLTTRDGALEVPAFAVPVLDTVGAGDAFAAGYLAGHVRGHDAGRRMRAAAALGAHAVMTVGDHDGLPDRAELDRFLTGQDGDLR